MLSGPVNGIFEYVNGNDMTILKVPQHSALEILQKRAYASKWLSQRPLRNVHVKYRNVVRSRLVIRKAKYPR